MSERLIENIIQIAQQQESNAHGGNKKCYLIDNYALLSQKFTTEEIEKMMQITQELESKGVNIARVLDYQILEQNTQYWNTNKNAIVSDGYVLQQRAIGEPLLDETNRVNDGQRFQIDYFKQIDSIAQEGQEFFNNFVKGWLEIEKAGLSIDPSKPSNFIYKSGQDITFIDLNISNDKINNSMLVRHQLAVILNSKTFNACYPEIQQAVSKRFKIIMEKYKNALIEQGIDIEDNYLNMEASSLIRIPSEQEESIEETPEQEMERLKECVAEHVKTEQMVREENRRIQKEKEEKARIEKEKAKAEQRRLDEEEERKNGGKRRDSKMYAILYGLIENNVIPENQIEELKQVFQIKRNIYADLNGQLFKKQGTKIDLKSVIPAIEENSSINIDMREMKITTDDEISDQNYEVILTAVKDYFKGYFEDISQKTNEKLLEYNTMKKRYNEGSLDKDEYREFRLLEAELNEFANIKQLSLFLDIDEKTIENSERVSAFLQDANRFTDEKKAIIESKKRENDRDYIGAVFKETGITDPEQLRKIYYEQDNIRVEEEDLEIVLANFSPVQIGKATARAGIGISEINQTTQYTRKVIEQDINKENELSN